MLQKIDNLLREIGQEYPECGFYCPEEWFDIVSRCLRDLTFRFQGWTLAQVKEKFGNLRIYVDVDEKMSESDFRFLFARIDLAEQEVFELEQQRKARKT